MKAHRERDAGISLVYCTVDAADADAMGNEPVFDGERVIGITTSGAYGPTVRRSLAFAYVESAYASPGTTFDVGILGGAPSRHRAGGAPLRSEERTTKGLSPGARGREETSILVCVLENRSRDAVSRPVSRRQHGSWFRADSGPHMVYMSMNITGRR